jgi:hypothetical protein
MNANERDRLLSRWRFGAFGHLFTSIGLWWAGFAYGMRSFTESGAGDIAAFFFRLQALINFPVVFIERDRLLQQIGRGSSPSDIWERGIGPYPSAISFLWSIVLDSYSPLYHLAFLDSAIAMPPPTSANHALQRTRATVTATATNRLRPVTTFPQCPRPRRVSLSYFR